LLAQITSLVATAWLVWNLSALPPVASSAPASAIWGAVEFTLLAWLWGAAVALALQYAIRRVEQVDLAGATLRTSLVAVWFAPAVLLMYRLTPATVVAALVLVVNATRLLYTQWTIVYQPTGPDLPVAGPAVLFGDGAMPPPFLTRHLGPALAIAAGLQFGIAAATFRHSFLAGALLTMGVATLTVFAISTGGWESPRPTALPRSIFGTLLTVALAAGLTILASGGGLPDSSGSYSAPDRPSSPSVGDFLARSQPTPSPPRTGSAAWERSPADQTIPGAADVAGSFPGVVLWPEIKQVTTLIAPLPGSPGAFAARKLPYGIPFGGEYWFLRSLFRRPPPHSVFLRGTPWKLSFSTTDHWALNMEAHQKLEQPIDISCCSRIQIAVSNADRYPHTVSIELILRDLPGGPSRNLGTAPVASLPDLKADPVTPVGETLDFAVPRESHRRVFNEITVVFRCAWDRRDKSARVSIERFVLVPRGWS
jgi:hypothetical protein